MNCNRLFAFILTCMVLLSSCAVQNINQQSTPAYYEQSEKVVNFPFQVVYAENTFLNETRKIDQALTLIGKDDTISLRGGHLIMVHYLGEFFEFTGNTTIVVADLIYEKYGILTSQVKTRLNIAPLFSTDRVYNFTGIVIRCPSPGIEFRMQSPDDNIIIELGALSILK